MKCGREVRNYIQVALYYKHHIRCYIEYWHIQHGHTSSEMSYKYNIGDMSAVARSKRPYFIISDEQIIMPSIWPSKAILRY